MTTLFIDESGYTGPDLMDADTPYYATSAVRITEERAQELKALHFSHKTTELKFSGIKPGKNMFAVRDLVTTLLEENAVQVTVVDKRFALTAKIFEYIAGPYLEGLGAVYANGFLPRMANHFHRELLKHPLEVRNNLHGSFQQAMIQQSQNELRRFEAEMANLTGDAAAIAQKMLVPSLQTLGMDLVEKAEVTEGNLGILISCAFSNLLRWGVKLPVTEPIHVVYDAHSVIEAELELWNQFTAAHLDVESNNIDYRLNHQVITSLGKSEDEVGIQIADLVAGYAAYAVKNTRQPVQRSQHQQLRDTPAEQVAYELFTHERYAKNNPLHVIEVKDDSVFTGWHSRS